MSKSGKLNSNDHELYSAIYKFFAGQLVVINRDNIIRTIGANNTALMMTIVIQIGIALEYFHILGKTSVVRLSVCRVMYCCQTVQDRLRGIKCA